MIKAIIFDVDGVLIDADKSRVEKYRVLLKEHKDLFEVVKYLVLSNEYSGINWLVEQLEKRSIPYPEDMEKRYADGIDVDLRFYPLMEDSTKETLEKLARKHILVAYSAATKEITTKKLEYNKILHLFTMIFCGNTGDSNAKENTISSAIDYLNSLGIINNEIAIVDDRVQAGIVIGKKYNLYRIRFNRGTHSTNEYVPNKVIDTLKELL